MRSIPNFYIDTITPNPTRHRLTLMYGRYCREEIFVYMFIYDLNNIEYPRELIDKLYSVSEVIPTGAQPGEKKTTIAAQLFEILGDRYDEVLNELQPYRCRYGGEGEKYRVACGRK
ncbi:MAG: hypothetical protein SPH44_02505 [Eubacteriales bacterium]|nr:hypothetical protein [Eubacteriales bacterium]